MMIISLSLIGLPKRKAPSAWLSTEGASLKKCCSAVSSQVILILLIWLLSFWVIFLI